MLPADPSDSNADPFRYRPAEAVRAVRALLQDPEDTEQVFVVVRALSGKSLIRGFNRFVGTATGRAILAENRQLIETLRDRAHLAALPADSLGRAYLRFMETENISADGLVDASETGQLPQSRALNLYACRLRDMHDIWHVTTGYGRDTMGEVCLLGFTFGQTRNPGLAFIALVGALKIAREEDRRILRALWAGYRAGRQAEWLPAADWEALLTMPLEAVRARLRVAAPSVYPVLRADRALQLASQPA
jgi:ubiquinone biosynthesis protein COQ4